MTESVAKLASITDETTPRRAAELYHAAGLDPIPIHGIVDGKCTCRRDDCDKSRGKHPVGKEWESREIYLDEFTSTRNVGLRMGGQSRLVAIDVDGSIGIESIAALESRFGKLPKTLTSESGSGGRHLIFRSREIDRIRNSAKKLGPNVDVRSNGGQVVVAPSRHLSGGRYRWLALYDVADLPEAWESEILRLNNPEPVATPALDAARKDGDGGDRYERARAYIAKMPSAISGSGGHDATWAVACKLVHGFGLSDEDALSILRTDYNSRCEPEWSELELDHKVKSARAQAAKLASPVEAREWTQPAPWTRSDYVPEIPAWVRDDGWEEAEEAVAVERPVESTTTDPATSPDPESVADDVERDAIQGEPKAPKPARQPIEILSMQQLLAPIYEQMKTSGTNPWCGIPTGLAELDEAIGGYRSGNVTILGGKTSFGKTSFSLLSIDSALAAGCRVLAFGGEDSPTMYGKRFMARRSGVNATLLRDMREPFTDVQMRHALDALTRSEPSPFFVNAIDMPVERIAEIILETATGDARWLVVVDYLQCLITRRSSSDRRIELTYIAKTVSSAIKKANAAGLVISQLRRTEKRRPEKEDLKESGDIENEADHICLGHREDAAPNQPERRILIVAKNKDGCDDVPDIELKFDRVTASFVGSTARARDTSPIDPRASAFRSGSRTHYDDAPAPPPRPFNERHERDDDGFTDGFGGLPPA